MAQIKISDSKIDMCKELMLNDPEYKGKNFKNYSDIPNELMDSYLRQERDRYLIKETIKECSNCACDKIISIINQKQRVIHLGKD